MNDLPVIALRTESATKASHWRDLLAGMNCTVVTDSDPAGGGGLPDLVITDSTSGSMPVGIHGVIAIGAALAADVALPDEPTKRELQLACGLLFEIVQLRRECEASRQTQQQLIELAELDALTGLANRRAWDAELARRMKRDCQADATLCLALFDLDHFKGVNTTHGYPAADKMLQHVASTLKASVRADDFVSRIGGDEFGVLLSSISTEHAETVVERLRASLEPALERAGVVVVTATAGLAMRGPRHDAESLFAIADANLRQGKLAGRNRTVAST